VKSFVVYPASPTSLMLDTPDFKEREADGAVIVG
jgi:hypothetical protein